MTRTFTVALVVLAVAVLIGLISLRGLRRHMRRMAVPQLSEEQARREVLAPPISTASDVPTKAEIFWAGGAETLAPVEMELPLSADPAVRSKQLIEALVTRPPSSLQRTLPAGVTLLGFYVLPDGTAIADFSDTLASDMPSGILSESLAVNSIARTLSSNVPSLRRLKILIHGQEAETLAGHLDLSGFFDLNPPPAPAAPAGAAPPASPAPHGAPASP